MYHLERKNETFLPEPVGKSGPNPRGERMTCLDERCLLAMQILPDDGPPCRLLRKLLGAIGPINTDQKGSEIRGYESRG